MSRRTTVGLDEETQEAVRQLALSHGCSASEAIRRAVKHYRETVPEVRPDTKAIRRKALERLFVLFENHDAAAEISLLKHQDRGF